MFYARFFLLDSGDADARFKSYAFYSVTVCIAPFSHTRIRLEFRLWSVYAHSFSESLSTRFCYIQEQRKESDFKLLSILSKPQIFLQEIKKKGKLREKFQ